MSEPAEAASEAASEAAARVDAAEEAQPEKSHDIAGVGAWTARCE